MKTILFLLLFCSLSYSQTTLHTYSNDAIGTTWTKIKFWGQDSLNAGYSNYTATIINDSGGTLYYAMNNDTTAMASGIAQYHLIYATEWYPLDVITSKQMWLKSSTQTKMRILASPRKK